MQKFSNLLSS